MLRIFGLSGTQLRVFGLTYIAYALLYIGRKSLSVTKARMQTEAGVPIASLGLMDTAFLIAYAAGQLGLGPVAERAGSTHGLFVCFVVRPPVPLSFEVASSVLDR